MNRSLPLRFDRSIPLVEAIFRIVEGTGSEVEALEILLEAESESEVRFVTKHPSVSPEPFPLERYREVVEPRIDSFLTQTHLVLGSSEYNRLEVIIAENYTYEWTHREWGYTLANWANKHQWLGHDEWNYLDFYGGPNDRVVTDYNAWCEAAMKLIEQRSMLRSKLA